MIINHPKTYFLRKLFVCAICKCYVLCISLFIQSE